jgi:hypothetical protein
MNSSASITPIINATGSSADGAKRIMAGTAGSPFVPTFGRSRLFAWRLDSVWRRRDRLYGCNGLGRWRVLDHPAERSDLFRAILRRIHDDMFDGNGGRRKLTAFAEVRINAGQGSAQPVDQAAEYLEVNVFAAVDPRLSPFAGGCERRGAGAKLALAFS